MRIRCDLPRCPILCCNTIRTECTLFSPLIRRSKNSRLHAQSTAGCRVFWSMSCSLVARELSCPVSGLVSRAAARVPAHRSAMINIIVDLSTYKTCLLTLGSSFRPPVLVSAPAGAPNLTSSYLSPPGLRICREMAWSLPSEVVVVAVVGLMGACPAAELDSAFALRVAAEPYTGGIDQ